jgi:hypothetical protein
VTDPQSRPVPGPWTAGQPDARRPGAASPPVPGPPRPAVPGPAVPAAPVPGPAAPVPGPAVAAAAPGPAPAQGGTGDLRVDAALARLDGLDELPVAEHVGEYNAVHRALQDALTTIDES